MVGKLGLAGFIMALTCVTALAQQQQTKDAARYTGAGAWIVTKGDLKDPKSWGHEKPLADFATETEAEDYAHKLNQQSEADPYRWSYSVRKRQDDDPKSAGPELVENTGKRGGLITNPGLPTVDPGEIKLSGRAKSVAGQTGTGVIGDKKVTITFTGKDGKGRFKIGGELSAEGDYEQSGAGVTFETTLSKFRGVVRGDKLAGVRFTKKSGEDGSNALTEWSATLSETVDLTGTEWGRSPSIKFIDGRSMSIRGLKVCDEGIYELNGDTVRFKAKNARDDRFTAVGTLKLKGNLLSGEVTWSYPGNTDVGKNLGHEIDNNEKHNVFLEKK